MNKEIEGHTLPYHSLIVALRICFGDYLERYKELQDIGSGITELDSRRITIIILTAALCESCINTWLALNLDEDCFSIIEKVSPVEKWVKVPRLILKDYEFPAGEVLYQDLKEVFRCRDSIMHQKTEVQTTEGVLHRGNHDRWESFDHNKVRRIVGLPISLLEHLSKYDRQDSIIKSAKGIFWHVSQYMSVIHQSKPERL